MLCIYTLSIRERACHVGISTSKETHTQFNPTCAIQTYTHTMHAYTQGDTYHHADEHINSPPHVAG